MAKIQKTKDMSKHWVLHGQRLGFEVLSQEETLQNQEIIEMNPGK